MDSHRLSLQEIDCAQATIQTLLTLQLLSWSAARTNADMKTEPRRVEETLGHSRDAEWLRWWGVSGA